MRVSLQSRLTIALVVLTTAILAMTLLVARWSFVRGFADYIDGLEEDRLGGVATAMSQIYEVNGGWPPNLDEAFQRAAGRPAPHGFAAHVARGPVKGRPFEDSTSAHPRPARGQRPPEHKMDRGPSDGPSSSLSRRRPKRRAPHPTALFDTNDVFIVGDQLSNDVHHISTPVRANGEVVGYIRSAPERDVSRPLEAAFLRKQLWVTVAIWSVALLLASVIAFLLARRVLAPIRELIDAVSQLTSGNYSVTMNRERDDEIGDLVANFESLAATLQTTRDARQRLFADISHELRTPLSVLSAELEALRDGVRPFDQSSLESLHEELVRLRHLVDDLRTLSMSDLGSLQYHFAEHDLTAIVSSTLEALPTGELVVETKLDDVMARVDRGRMEQLLRNLLMNSITYTDSPGRIEIELHADSDIVIRVSDSAPSVAPEDCEQLFDPLFRVEASRSRARAGSGLGLAICRRIVAAHEGSIIARPSLLGGLEIEVSLPQRRKL